MISHRSTHRVQSLAIIAVICFISALPLGPSSRDVGAAFAQPSEHSFTFAAGGDIGATDETTTTLSAVAAANPDFFLALGDLSYSQLEPESAWCSYIEAQLPAVPIELVVGNHEDDSLIDGDIREFAECLPDRMGSTGTYGAEYYFDVDGLMRIIMIGADSTVDGERYDYDVGTSHYQWLSDAIDGARASEIPWVAVGVHKVCISAGVKPCEVGADLMDLLIDKNVDLVLSGHEHNYQRSKQLTCATVNLFVSGCVSDDGSDGSYTKGAGAVFVVTGAMGGRSRYAIDPSDPEFPYFAETMGAGDSDEGSGFLSVNVSASRVIVDFVGTTSSFSDHFELTKPPNAEPTLFTARAPLEDIGSLQDAGAVTLLEMTPSGVIAGSALFHQGIPGIPSLNEAGDQFGHATVWADLDMNGIDDLIVGVPSEDIGNIVDAGAIVVLYDAASGSFSRADTIHQGSSGVPGKNEANDQWGYALAAGDLNHDTYPDLVIGAPNEAIGPVAAGAFTILYGSPLGLTTTASRIVHQNTPGVPGINENGDRFGASLAVAGQATSTPFLAVGSPAEDIGAVVDAGAVTLFAATDIGPQPEPALLYQGVTQSGNRPQVDGRVEAGDQWGSPLAASPSGMLVIGAPFDDPAGTIDAGSITLYAGFAAGARTQLVHQGTSGVPGSNETGDRWGYSLGSSLELIVVGAPFEDESGSSDAGRVTLIPHGPVGGAIVNASVLTQGNIGAAGGSQPMDLFGSSIGMTSAGDIFIGAAGEDPDGVSSGGSGSAIFSPHAAVPSFVTVHQGTAGVPGLNEPLDSWGD